MIDSIFTSMGKAAFPQLVEHMGSLKKYSPIKVGEPAPYKPPK